MVPASDTEGLAEVTRLLAAGTPFTEVAATEHNRINRDEGGLGTYVFQDPFEHAEIFRIAELNEAVHTLEPGRHTGPIAYNDGRANAWLMLEKIERVNNSLYDVQYGIERTLRAQREEQAREAYINRLKERASFTSVETMTERLTRIAENWYYEPTARGR